MNIPVLKTTENESENNTKVRKSVYGTEPEILTSFYEEETGIVVWKRELTAEFKVWIEGFLKSNSSIQLSMTVTPESVYADLKNELGDDSSSDLCRDIAELVDMFCCLFGVKVAGLRLTALSHAMCPKFHVDRVPGRLVTTYQGKATEWLPHEVIDRSKLGAGCNGLADHESGLYQDAADIQQLTSGDVSLLKGELWEGNENAGLVHRSPQPEAGENRLLLTLDVLN